MALIIQKYGGTSVANAERVKEVAKRVLKYRKEGHNVIVVVSAPAGTTDSLIKRAYEISDSPNKRRFRRKSCFIKCFSGKIQNN